MVTMKCKLCEGECKGTDVKPRELLKLIGSGWKVGFAKQGDIVVCCEESAEEYNGDMEDCQVAALEAANTPYY
jgi:hypothetical protein